MPGIKTLSELEKCPIPEPTSSRGWKDVLIVENGEKLVLLNNLSPTLIRIDPQYLKQNIPFAIEEMYLRDKAAKALIRATELLPDGLKIVVWDAWRSLDVQQSLFDTFKAELARKNPEWDDNRLNRETQTYVSLPSSNSKRPSPHSTGGAIDLSICDFENKPLPMGVPFDFFGKESSTNYYENLSNITQEQIVYRNNRRLLFHAMTRAGFTNYDKEYWHYDFGNQFDAIRKNTIAVYGVIAPD